jgi:uncharacterized protein (TIGR03663 family)
VGVGGFFFRYPRLDKRPLHTDEAVHTVKAGILLETGRYVYDPHEYHGPTLYFATLPLVRLSGARSLGEISDVFPFRFVPVLFGTGLIFLLLLFRSGLGPRGAVVSALLTAVSPAMLYYSRYYIMEMLLVFFSFAAIVAAWRYTRDRKLVWALLCGASIGLMHATKETCVIAYASMLGAVGLTLVWTRWVDGHHLNVRDAIHHWHAVGALKVAAAISILSLTVLLSNPAATLDSLRSYSDYIQRASGGDPTSSGPAIHFHPWHFYLHILLFFRVEPGPWWSEGLIMILGLLGVVTALRPRHGATEANLPLIRFLAFYTLLLTAVYSLIPYKTPWCMLGFLHGWILMAGIGVVAIVRRLRRTGLKLLGGLLLVAGAFQQGCQAYRAAYVFDADTRNPYVYAHTSTDLLNLADRMEAFAEVHPAGHGMPIYVMAPGSDYWPLPWYLRRFENVGYWEEIPAKPEAPVLITVPGFEERLDDLLEGPYEKEFFGLRPSVLLTVYTQKALWDSFLEKRTGG